MVESEALARLPVQGRAALLQGTAVVIGVEDFGEEIDVLGVPVDRLPASYGGRAYALVTHCGTLISWTYAGEGMSGDCVSICCCPFLICCSEA